jgi:RNA polymerase sigma-70 factor (sigma-E family)
VIDLRDRSKQLSGSRQDEEFRRFAKRFLPSLLKAAYLLTRDIDLAEDVVQGTLLRVFKHWGEARQAPEAYSRQVLLNICRDQWRRDSRRPRETPFDDDALVGDGAQAGDETSFTDRLADREALKGALHALPEQQREILVLRFFFDLSVSQTAEILGIPEGTVKSSVHRGKRQLLQLLAAPNKEAETC